MPRTPAPLLLILAAVAALALPEAALPLTMNLARPYDESYAPTRSRDVAFFAPAAEDYLFDQSTGLGLICQPIRRGLELHWSLKRNRVNAALASGRVLPGPDNSFTIAPPTENLTPGFYDLHVTIDTGQGKPIRARTTFGWRADQQQIPTNEPADFDAFWDRARAKLAEAELDLRVEFVGNYTGKQIDAYNVENACLPPRYDPQGVAHDQVELYRVSFAGAPGMRVHGWFARPAGAGTYPAMLVLPGAGNAKRPAPLEHARHGYAALDIQVHGHELELDRYPRLPDEYAEDPTESLYYSVYLNALQAVSALGQLPGADVSRLVTVGGSQGGQLSIVVAALDDRVQAAVPAITYYAARPWQQWTHQLNRAARPGLEPFTIDQLKPTPRTQAEAYFDVLHFARRVDCPVLVNAGLIDPVSPATSVYALYQALGGPKQFVPLPNQGHDWSPAFDRRAWRWLTDALRQESPTDAGWW